MPLAEMQAAGSNSYVANLLNQGYGEAAILGRLADRFRNEPDVSYQAALRQGRRAWSAGTEMTLGADDTRLRASQVPLQGGPPVGYSYTVALTVQDTVTQAQRTLTVRVDTSESITRAMLAEQALERMRDLVADAPRRSRSYNVGPSLLALEMDVYAVERGRSWGTG